MRTLTKYLLLIAFASYLCLGQLAQPPDEITLGLHFRTSILANAPEAPDAPQYDLARQVFGTLLATATARVGPRLPYELTLLRGNVVNAFTTPGGKVYATSAIASILGDNRGKWAAVLGHELGHSIGQHFYKAYLRDFQHQLQVAYYRARAQQGDQSAYWALLGAQVAGGLVNLKLSRDDEHEADHFGLMMMAEAGYHPDFAVTLYRTLGEYVGDKSKVAAFFFSTHPRLATREQRTMRLYEGALAHFQSRWPDPERSPGGRPPLVGTIGRVSVSRDSVTTGIVVSAAVTVHNAHRSAVWITVGFFHRGTPVPAALREFRSTNGSLAAGRRFEPASSNQSFEATVSVPTAALGTQQRKLQAVVALVADGEILDTSRSFDVSFPR